ncbi:hypothetical protein CK203_027273 [Vitis vinifera]|uniref:Reverse transcriptase zinc-binding domain-containing protein n=1 Tax=Vitis vinifera TaxID=29760 RepID=A0A438J9G4_VITVI|nr:hypothetical protein CK203_027273 [Vitis vinifera]
MLSLLVDQRSWEFGLWEDFYEKYALLGKWLWRFPRERECFPGVFPFCPPSGGPWREFGSGKIFGGIQERGLCLRQVVSVKSFFLALSKVSNPLMFLPAKFLWSSKVPSKVKALAWLVAHGKVNTNAKLQLRRPTKPSILNGAFFAKEMESRLTTFSSLSRYHWTLGTGCSI